MSTMEAGSVIALLGLGALHGVNPAMGWLFAAAVGLQERSARAVWRALPPLAAGHALSVAAFIAAATVAGAVLSGAGVRILTTLLLTGAGGYRLIRGHRHVAYGGMRMRGGELVLWSFLMATAHGAGLMVVPFLPAPELMHGAHGHHAGMHEGGILLAGQAGAIGAALLHTASYLAVAGLLAVVFYHRAGYRLLRSAWVNLDLIWAAALLATGIFTMLPLLRGLS